MKDTANAFRSEVDPNAVVLGLTNNFRNGVPRSFRFSKDGSRLFFLRSISGRERQLDLWYQDTTSGQETKLWSADEPLRKRRPSLWTAASQDYQARARESATGIVDFDIGSSGELCAFSLDGAIHVLAVLPSPRHLYVSSRSDAISVRLSPDSSHLSYVSKDELFVSRIVGNRVLAGVRISPAASADQFWGRPDFIGAEEMARYDGQWWSPNSKLLIYEGVDNRAVTKWNLCDPSAPSGEVRTIPYPQAGTTNASLELRLWNTSGVQVPISWNTKKYPYLVAVGWRNNQPIITVQTRDQCTVVSLRVNVSSGKTRECHRTSDRSWVELVPGVPSWDSRGELINVSTSQKRQLVLNGRIISKPGLQIRKYIGQRLDGSYIYTGSTDPLDTQVWSSTDSREHRLLSPAEGVYDAAIGGNSVVIYGTSLKRQPHYNLVKVHTILGKSDSTLESHAELTCYPPRPQFHRTPGRGISYAICLPHRHDGFSRLPVLLDPYGGPHGQRCRHSALSFTTSQWFAEQGFAVIVADGRGTPGRDRKWETAVAGNLLQPAARDQMSALKDSLHRYPFLDPSRVAIRGWSFGGYLALGTLLVYPKAVRAAIAGAPVTDWRFYDTHYSERYLGLPNKENSYSYERSSLLQRAGQLQGRLLMIHGFIDDNVHIAHSLMMSRSLLNNGKPHSLLALGNLPHSPQAETTPLLLSAELKFLREVMF